jgi:hypothetical protein
MKNYLKITTFITIFLLISLPVFASNQDDLINNLEEWIFDKQDLSLTTPHYLLSYLL